MTNEQEKLYQEWKAVEDRLLGFLHGQVIQYSDIQIAQTLRPRVWNELKSYLTIAEKFDLGSKLQKPRSEIFDHEYPPKSWSLNQQWATRAIHRASGGFNFLLECLEHIHRGGTDPAYSRSAYVLLSYHAELLFEAYLLFQPECSIKNAKELESVLRGKHNHDLSDLANKIGKERLGILGVTEIKTEIKKEFKRYIVKMVNGDKIVVEDSIDVRYDFKYDKKRDIDPEESSRMRIELGHLLSMTKKVMEMVPKI